MAMTSTSSAYILTNKVTHARILPLNSAHAFSYPTVACLFPLRALESKALDIGRGWVFGYGGVAGRVIGIRPQGYLYDDVHNEHRLSIFDKLKKVLSERGYPADQLYDAWMLTMPSYFGFEGINPLTVYYAYKSDGSLWLVILEIHNTFSERHVHVLCVGKDEDTQIPQNYDHSWTFSRQFHVSPFNDRSGHYTCAIVAPSYAPFKVEDTQTLNQRVAVRVHLYTHPSPSQPSQLKLTATLRSTSIVPLTSSSLFATLAQYPFALFLSFARIAYHAWILHYVKRLDVYIRPDPAAPTSTKEDGACATLESLLPASLNRPQGGSGGGVAWQKEGIFERYARIRTERFLERRSREMDVKIVLESTNPVIGRKVIGSGDGSRCLHIVYRSPRVFTLLLEAPRVGVFVVAACDGERLMGVSDEKLFLDIMSTSAPIARGVSFAYSFLSSLRNVPLSQSLKSPRWSTTSPYHPLDTSRLTLPLNLLIIITFQLLSAIERTLFMLFRARVVRGDEPWLVWTRAEGVILLKGRGKDERTGAGMVGEDERFSGESWEYGSRDRDGGGLGSVRRN